MWVTKEPKTWYSSISITNYAAEHTCSLQPDGVSRRNLSLIIPSRLRVLPRRSKGIAAELPGIATQRLFVYMAVTIWMTEICLIDCKVLVGDAMV